MRDIGLEIIVHFLYNLSGGLIREIFIEYIFYNTTF